MNRNVFIEHRSSPLTVWSRMTKRLAERNPQTLSPAESDSHQGALARYRSCVGARLRLGNAAHPIVSVGSAETSMTFTRRKRRGIFGSVTCSFWKRGARASEQLQQDRRRKRFRRRAEIPDAEEAEITSK